MLRREEAHFSKEKDALTCLVYSLEEKENSVTIRAIKAQAEIGFMETQFHRKKEEQKAEKQRKCFLKANSQEAESKVVACRFLRVFK